MNLEVMISEHLRDALKSVYDHETEGAVALQPTSAKFEGSFTFVTFPLAKVLGEKPDLIAQKLGEHLVANTDEIDRFNVVKGFLNLVVSDRQWVSVLEDIKSDEHFTRLPDRGERMMVEYSSPNTNKPLHLGHLRNNFLGHSLSLIMEANGLQTIKANLVNDRGIHICKSMVAYEQFGQGETPTHDRKGDKLVGDYYVKFDQVFKQQQAEWLEAQKPAHDSLKALPDLVEFRAKMAAKSKKGEVLTPAEKAALKTLKDLQPQAERAAPIMKAAQDTLRKWEAGDAQTVALWEKMNGWVYDGFDQTYRRMGVSFDKFYYESETYLLGKEIVEEGLEKGIFYRKDDQSVWVDLSEDGLDHKLLLRGDGTSVYITQDMGTADLKYKDFGMKRSVYVVGNEQDYHFKVLQLIMQKLKRPYANGMYHMSYGMVDLPSGKMKSREGTVVDADDLIAQMEQTAKIRTLDLGKIEGFDEQEAEALYQQLALGALKYYLLRVEPKKRILFNPEESVDFQGDTGVYIQYNHAKIRSLIRRAEREGIDFSLKAWQNKSELLPVESEVINLLHDFPKRVVEAAREYSPSVIAQYALLLARTYSRFYAECSIFGAVQPEQVAFRLALSEQTARMIREALSLLGIAAPEKM